MAVNFRVFYVVFMSIFYYNIHQLIQSRNYRIFSIKRPRRLFQTWPGEPGVCLNQQFIWARHFLRMSFYSFHLTSCILAIHLLKVHDTTNKRLRGLFPSSSFRPGVYLGPGV